MTETSYSINTYYFFSVSKEDKSNLDNQEIKSCWVTQERLVKGWGISRRKMLALGRTEVVCYVYSPNSLVIFRNMIHHITKCY